MEGPRYFHRSNVQLVKMCVILMFAAGILFMSKATVSYKKYFGDLWRLPLTIQDLAD